MLFFFLFFSFLRWVKIFFLICFSMFFGFSDHFRPALLAHHFWPCVFIVLCCVVWCVGAVCVQNFHGSSLGCPFVEFWWCFEAPGDSKCQRGRKAVFVWRHPSPSQKHGPCCCCPGEGEECPNRLGFGPGLHTTGGPGASKPPKCHEKTPRERQKERKLGGTAKKREILGLPPFGAPPFEAPPFLGLGLLPSGPHLSGSHPVWSKNSTTKIGRSRKWPKSTALDANTTIISIV